MLAALGFPRVGEHRRFVAAIVADTVGSGLFMPVTLLYFLRVTDLGLVQIGSALSLSALLTIPASFFVGTLVDTFGARRMMLVANVLQAAGMVGYLFADSFWAVAGWTVLLNVGRQAFWGSFGNVVTAITQPGERETWFGFLQALRNLGFALGGLLAGVVLQVDLTSLYRAVVLVNVLTFALAFWLLLAVPDHHRGAEPGKSQRGGWAVVLRDRGFLRLVVAQFTWCMGMMVLNFALPVYVVESLDLPGALVGVIFTLNTVMVGLGQGLVVRWMSGRVRGRMVALANVLFVGGYAVFVVAGLVPVWVGVAAMLLGAAVYTLGELVAGPVLNATAAEAAPDHLRGRYLGLLQLSWGVTGALAPVAFTWFLTHGTFSLWWALGALAVAGAVWAARLPAALPAAAQRVTHAGV